jgi:hypothetical protein
MELLSKVFQYASPTLQTIIVVFGLGFAAWQCVQPYVRRPVKGKRTREFSLLNVKITDEE